MSFQRWLFALGVATVSMWLLLGAVGCTFKVIVPTVYEMDDVLEAYEKGKTEQDKVWIKELNRMYEEQMGGEYELEDNYPTEVPKDYY
jgi:hypothetical protein